MGLAMKLVSLIRFAACIPVQTSSQTSTSARSVSALPAPSSSSSSSPPSVAAEDRWFVTESTAVTGPEPAVEAQLVDDAWLDTAGAPLRRELTHGVRTTPATLANIRGGRPMIARCNDRWYLIAARKFDEATATIELGRDGNEVCPLQLPLANLRVIVEFKNRGW